MNQQGNDGFQLDLGSDEPEKPKIKRQWGAESQTPQPAVPAEPQAEAARAPARSAVPPPVEDQDLKPGSRKDLWNCPHCGTGNQPQRESCRSCGKRPEDPRAKPWYLSPAVLGGVAAAIVLVVAIVVLTRPDLSLKPADADHLDRSVRQRNGSGESRDHLGMTFDPTGSVAVCGRIVAAKTVLGGSVRTVVLALGAGAATDAGLDAIRVEFTADGPRVEGGPHVVLHLLGTKGLDEGRGRYLSLTGTKGDLTEAGRYIPLLKEGLTVAVESVQQ